MTHPFFVGNIEIDERAKSGAEFLVGNPETGDIARARWTGSMWAICGGEADAAVEQLDFEPTHYKPGLRTIPVEL